MLPLRKKLRFLRTRRESTFEKTTNPKPEDIKTVFDRIILGQQNITTPDQKEVLVPEQGKEDNQCLIRITR